MSAKVMLAEAKTFDYIIVGSGAGGAPLAARLAQKGKRVLVLEAGSDHAALSPTDPAHEVSRVPGLHAVSTEHDALAWRFYVDHYERTGGKLPDGIPEDPKWHKGATPESTGIFYPRASGIGGCTIHNAMITIAGPDSDWDEIADFLGDESWRGARMRPYFQRLENNGYLPPPRPAARSKLQRLRRYIKDSLRWLVGLTPDGARGKHGFNGWLGTSVTDISLGLRDRQLIRMLRAALRHARSAGLERTWTLVGRFLRGQITEALDPNHRRTQTTSPEGIVLIPVAVHGATTTIHQDRSSPYEMRGRRSSPRELLMAAKANHAANLEIWTDCLVTKVLLSDGPPWRAIGVEFQRGKNLYRAHAGSDVPNGPLEKVHVQDGGEVILCGGSFNTPQLLMLSGIGDRKELSAVGLTCNVELPGVGRNLQDRYEISVVCDMQSRFSLLDGATYTLPDDSHSPDKHLRQWREEGKGLYTSNGAVLGILKRSRPDLAQPDLFIFGIPSNFQGYEIDYSVFKPKQQRFTWVILKSHTTNRDGRVRLRDTDPRSRPLINFHYFNEITHPDKTGDDTDLLALIHGVKFVRGIFKRAGYSVTREVHPGLDEVPSDSSEKLKAWIRGHAWGHHACGTCRMGPEGDEGAVLDTRFRVRKVNGLRVVDASIFPKIPGYFIVTNIYMASEKAADVILADADGEENVSTAYPAELRAIEAEAVGCRRAKLAAGVATVECEAKLAASVTSTDPIGKHVRWNKDILGLALAGGGIRSATLCLGMLQTMARANLVRKIDILSTVSGGGYIGACLGRFYDRLRSDPSSPGPVEPAGIPPADQIEAELSNPESATVEWLRKHGNYIAPQGRGDGRSNFATFVRNLLSVHLVVGLALFSLFGIAVGIRYGLADRVLAISRLAIAKEDFPIGHLIATTLGPLFSPWFILVELFLLFMVVPRIIGYWLVSEDNHGRYKGLSLTIMFVVAVALLGTSVTLQAWEPFFIALALLSSLIQVELAWRHGEYREEAMGTGGVETQRLRTRNYLTYDLGLALAMTGVALGFAIIDTLAHGLQEWKLRENMTYAQVFGILGGAIVALAPLGNRVARLFAGRSSPTTALERILLRGAMLGAMSVVLFTLPLLLYAFAAHAVYVGGTELKNGLLVTAFACILTLMLAAPQALTFVNRSSLAQVYAARLARAYLGASNPLRRRPDGIDVTEVIPGDDVASIRDYRPHEASGPLHLINVTLNQTVDEGSLLRKRDRHGENMAVTCLAMSVGEAWHSKWADSSNAPRTAARKVPARLEPVGRPVGTLHPLVDQLDQPADPVEMLSLRQWIGISGGAIDPGRGSDTNLGLALLMGLVNLRTGYWWDTGIAHADRLGYPDLTLTRRLLYLVPRVFAAQSLILYEWLARFPGPWTRYWHLTDGGFFEVTGAYELIRRRVPRIILCDGSADPKYQLGSLANLSRKVRIDFGATIESFTQEELDNHIASAKIRPLLGTEDELKRPCDAKGDERSSKHATLFWIHYADDPNRKSVMLYLKATVTGDEPTDVKEYYDTHREFPHEGTADQFFDEAQWESYRRLGEHIADPLLCDSAWFWKIPI